PTTVEPPVADDGDPQTFGWLCYDDDGCSAEDWSCWFRYLVKRLYSALGEPNNPFGPQADMPPSDGDETQEGDQSDPSGASGGMKEDPYHHYHDHYPSCPYMGGCPYPHRYPVVLPSAPAPEPVPAPLPKPKKKVNMSLLDDEPGTVHADV